MIKKPTNKTLNNIAWLILPAMFFIGDRLLKNMALARKDEEIITLIPNLLYFNFYPNKNIAFSLPVPNHLALILSGLLIIFLIFIIYYFKTKKISSNLFIFPLILIVTGAISNLIDRLQHSYVIDYLQVPWFSIFNLADVLISLGGIALILMLIFKKK